jgi:hypothetical protein
VPVDFELFGSAPAEMGRIVFRHHEIDVTIKIKMGWRRQTESPPSENRGERGSLSLEGGGIMRLGLPAIIFDRRNDV